MTKQENYLVTSLIKILIENEYAIKTKTDYPRKTQANTIIERIHQLIENLVRTYNLQKSMYTTLNHGW